MNSRTLSIARAVILESLRRRIAPLIALLLVLAVPLVCVLFGGDADTREWIARSATAEGLVTLLPLTSVIGGAFLLQPGFQKGWSLLPARRSEQFLATALGGAVILSGAALLFTTGGMVANFAFAGDLLETRSPDTIAAQRTVDGERQMREQGRADPTAGEELFFEVPAHGDELRGSFEFLAALTGEPLTGGREVVDVYVRDKDGRRKAVETSESRSRVDFHAPVRGDSVRVIIRPVNPGLMVVAKPEGLRIEVGRASPVGSIGAILALALGASLLGLFFVSSVRSRATSTTSALAGLLLLAVLTLLPSLAPAQKMSRDRRSDLRGEQRKKSVFHNLDRTFSRIPRLVPKFPVDELVSGRTVPASAWLDGALRLGAGVVLIVPGALLYTRRQVAK